MTRLGGTYGIADALDDGANDLDKSPDSRNTDGASTDEADIASEDVLNHRKVATNLAGYPPRQDRTVRNKETDEDGRGHGNTNQVTDANERHRHAHANHRAATVARLERLGQRRLHKLKIRQQGVRCRDHRTDDDDSQTHLVSLGGTSGIAYFEHLSSCDALRVGKIRAGHEGPTQRNRVHNAEDAAD